MLGLVDYKSLVASEATISIIRLFCVCLAFSNQTEVSFVQVKNVIMSLMCHTENTRQLNMLDPKLPVVASAVRRLSMGWYC